MKKNNHLFNDFIDLNRLIKKSRILIVDDNKANLLALSSVLKPSGWLIDKASSGEEALKTCLKHDYNLFLLDVQMPNMNGFELAENLKSINHTKEVPIIFLTASSKDDSFSIKGYQAGAIDYLKKPINNELLLIKVNIFLELYHHKRYIKSLNKELEEKVKARSKELTQKKEILEGVLKSIKSQIALLNHKGDIILANLEWETFFEKNILNDIFSRKTKGNIFQKIKKEQKNSSTLLKIQRAVLKIVEGKESDFSIEYSYEINSENKWFLMRITPYGSGEGVVISNTDITERKKDEEKVRLNEQKLKDIVNNISDAIFSIDNNLNIISWNKSCQNIYGYTEEEAINQPMDKLLQTDYIHFNKEKVNIKIKESSFWKGEIIQKNKQGANIFINANYKTIGYLSKKQGIAVLNKDITSIRKKEIELTNALILGEESERKRIASNLHDGLGQYLSGLRMHLQVIKEDVDAKYYSNLLSLIDTAIKEYRSVSHNIIPPNLSEDGLEGAIQLTCEKLNSNIIQIIFKSNLKNYRIKEEVRVELYRTFQELLNNALKHAQPKKINVELNVNDSNVLTLKIKDDGKGFDIQENIKTTKTGIGLNNILSRIHFLKGTIHMDSKINMGTQIEIKIKL